MDYLTYRRTNSDLTFSNKTGIFQQPDQVPSMGVFEAWAMGYTGAGVRIAVLDDGLDIGHPDLMENHVGAFYKPLLILAFSFKQLISVKHHLHTQFSELHT